VTISGPLFLLLPSVSKVKLKNIEHLGLFCYGIAMHALKDFLANRQVQKIIRWVFLLLLGGAIFVTIYFTGERSLQRTCDSCFAPGCVLIGLGFFSLVNHWGGFDFFLYGTSASLGALRKGTPKQYEDVMDYKEQKKEYRESSGPVYLLYFIYGVLWLAVSIVFYCLYRSAL
jgi:hypothetical protein